MENRDPIIFQAVEYTTRRDNIKHIQIQSHDDSWWFLRMSNKGIYYIEGVRPRETGVYSKEEHWSVEDE